MGSLVARRRLQSSKFRVAVFALVAASVVASWLISPISATAAQANVTVEQDQELLSETATNVLTTTTLAINRGSLPGGVTKFAPQPTVTLHVVGRVTGASASDAGWDVRLKSGSSTLATAEFRRADTSFKIPPPVSFPWPSTDKALTSLELVPVQSAGQLAGTFDLKKAYLRIKQTGVITKTLGRLHMGAKQVNNTNGSWARIADPGIYKHDAADFSPAPTVKLRATAVPTQCTIATALWDQTDDVLVAGSDLYFTSLESQESGSLTLTDGHEYSVRKEVIGGCGTQSQSSAGSESSQVDPPDAAGDFISADLVFEQSTADSGGLIKTAAWYAGVTAAADTSGGGNLDYLFTAPANVYPTDPDTANLVLPEWSYVAYRRSVLGSTAKVAAELQDRNILTGSESTATSSDGVAYDSSGAEIDAPVLAKSTYLAGGNAGIASGDYLDTRAILTDNPALPRISWSLRKQRIQLKDSFAPVLGTLTGNPSVFSPSDVNGIKDTVTYASSATDYSPLSWVATAVSVATGETVKTSPTTSGTSFSWTWNGKDSGDQWVDDGHYTVTTTATDGAGNASTSNVVTTTIDNTAPAIVDPSATQDLISPDGNGTKDSTTISATLSDLHAPITWSIPIRNSSNTIVRTLSGSGTSISAPWDGKNTAGTVVPDGTYAATIEAVDAVANKRLASSLSIRVDLTLPTVSVTAVDEPFSPNGDAVRPVTTVNATLSDVSTPISWVFDVKNGSGTVLKTWSGAGNSISQEWDGKDEAGVLQPEGSYTGVVRATDFAGNLRTVDKTLRIDSSAPTLGAGSANNPRFSPSGSKPTTTLSVPITLEPSIPVTYTVKIKNDAGVTVRTSPEQSTSSGTASWTWDGKNDIGSIVADGPYAPEFEATDAQALSAIGAGPSVTIDTVAPTLVDFVASPNPFNPDGAAPLDEATFSGAFSESVTWVLTIRKNGTVVHSANGGGDEMSTPWNGQTTLGDGEFVGTVQHVDEAGNAGSAVETTVIRDSTGPQVSDFGVTPEVFSPNGDGVRDVAVFSAAIDDEWAPTDWELTIRRVDEEASVRTISGSGEEANVSWDGRADDGHLVFDGRLRATLTVVDAGGNTTNSEDKEIVVDLTPPAIGFVAPKGNSNTMFTSQPIVAQLQDGAPVRAEGTDLVLSGAAEDGSGLESSSVQVLVEERSGTLPDQTLQASVDGGLLRSEPATLVPAHVYDATISAADIAGNSATASVSFLAIDTALATVPDVEIDAVAASSTTAGGELEGTNSYTWHDIQVELGPFEVDLPLTMHRGDGTVLARIPAADVDVTYKIAGVAAPPVHPEADISVRALFRVEPLIELESTESLTQGFAGSAATSDQVARVVDEVTALVPKVADLGSVRLQLSQRPAGDVTFPLCVDPTTSAGCFPDPIATDRLETIWEPWAGLLDVDPFDVPAATAERLGLELPADRCAGPPPTLEEAIENLGEALGTPDSIEPGLSLDPDTSGRLASIVECIAIHSSLLAYVDDAPTEAERIQWLAALRDVLALVREFEAFASELPQFIDTRRYVQVGSAGADTFSEDTILIVDPGGNDSYTNNSGGAIITHPLDSSPIFRPLAVVLDIGGNDDYLPSSSGCHEVEDIDLPYFDHKKPRIGAGMTGGVGILVDIAGNDKYNAARSDPSIPAITMGGCTQGAGLLGAGMLLDRDGSDSYSTAQNSCSHYNMGAAKKGFGFLVDAAVGLGQSNTFTANGPINMGAAEGIGFGSALPAGKGNEALGLLMTGVPVGSSDTYTIRNASVPCAEVDNLGAGFGATGVHLDALGQDSYSCRGKCIGFGDWGGIGVSYNAGLEYDSYTSTAESTTTSIALGAASLGGTGLAIDAGGIDTYNCQVILCQGVVTLPAIAMFADLSGEDDSYQRFSANRHPYFSTNGLLAAPRRADMALWVGRDPLAAVGTPDLLHFLGVGIDV